MPADQINWLNELKERISDDYWKKKKEEKNVGQFLETETYTTD